VRPLNCLNLPLVLSEIFRSLAAGSENETFLNNNSIKIWRFYTFRLKNEIYIKEIKACYINTLKPTGGFNPYFSRQGAKNVDKVDLHPPIWKNCQRIYQFIPSASACSSKF
jgi:hypothetical protein